jgi:hypothetical protein
MCIAETLPFEEIVTLITVSSDGDTDCPSVFGARSSQRVFKSEKTLFMYGERSAPFVSLNNSVLKFVDGGAGVASCARPACISIEVSRATENYAIEVSCP